MIMSNQELSEAIERTTKEVRLSGPLSEVYKIYFDHLEALLKIERERAGFYESLNYEIDLGNLDKLELNND